MFATWGDGRERLCKSARRWRGVIFSYIAPVKRLAWPDLGLNCRTAVKFDGQVLSNRHCDVPRADGHFPGSPCGEQREQRFGTALQSRDNPIVARNLRQPGRDGFPFGAEFEVKGDQAIKLRADELIGFDPRGRRQETGYARVCGGDPNGLPLPNSKPSGGQRPRK